MKQIILSFCLGIISPVASAQVGDTIRFLQSVWNMERKEIVLKFMQLTEAEKSAFWPVYDSYSEAIRYLEMEYIQILSDYPKDLKELSGEKAENLSRKILQNDLLLARARKLYYKKFRRAISPLRAGEFMQLDNALRTEIRFQAQKNISLAGTTSSDVYTKRNQNKP